MCNTCTIGLDFGTLSGRGVLVSCQDGQILAEATCDYSHGVLQEYLPDGKTTLPKGWALQVPSDYVDALVTIVHRLLADSDVDPSRIIGLGMDFTSCTVLPIQANGRALCTLPGMERRPHAYAKLWKHHGAVRQTERINAFLSDPHNVKREHVPIGKISLELMLPKAYEILEEDPDIYAQMSELVEAGDWLTRILTGSNARSCSMAGYKAWWDEQHGYPSSHFYAAIDPRLADFIPRLCPGEVVQMGRRLGFLSDEWADRLGLTRAVAVSPTIIDSHAGVAGCGLASPEIGMLVLGTSSVLIGLSRSPFSGRGVLGMVKDGVVPGYYALESGLAAVGDLFDWFVRSLDQNRVAVEKDRAAVHADLCRKAAQYGPGGRGVMALEWWNGNKTPYLDGALSGQLAGLSLETSPEEIYLALIEATAFGTKDILVVQEEMGVRPQTLFCSGGISKKNPFLMQIYADVLGRPLHVVAGEQTAALGSAIYASLAAGAAAGGHHSYAEAVELMGSSVEVTYYPQSDQARIYQTLYERHREWSEIMGNHHRTWVHKLKQGIL